MPFGKGELFGQRFEIDRVAGSGGMGVVYRAYDRISQREVALKLLHKEAAASHGAERFAREAELLAELRHENIVSYVAHGETLDGQRYLAMDWLDGEDLAHRLMTGGLSLHDSVICIRAAASALTAAHSRDIVHRDLKPSNLFLRQGQVGRTTLLDFGVARPRVLDGEMHPAPQSGAQAQEAGIGTPLYMSPEQARGDPDVGPCADIFSLGCVLYECITGRAPFRAAHAIAVLARILYEEPTPVSALRQEVPQALEDLLARMLAKDPQKRPQDAAALLREIDKLGDLGSWSSEAPLHSLPTRWLRGTEQRLVCVLVSSPMEGDRGAVSAIVGSFAGHVEWLLDRSLFVMLANPNLHSALDLANCAARCALALAKGGGVKQLALSFCRATEGTYIPSGAIIDQAVALLQVSPPDTASQTPWQIRLDRISARLLSRRFVVIREGETALLADERPEADDIPFATGLGMDRRMSIFGRESELSALDSFFHNAIDESDPRLVVLSGASGTGKTRLVQEHLRRLLESGEALRVFTGRGDPIGAALPYSVLEQVRPWPPAVPDASKFASEQARQGTATSYTELQDRFIGWLRAQAQEAPILLVIDDMQWADALSLAAIGRALQQLAGSPLLVLLLGRSDDKEGTAVLPARFAGLEVHEIVLKGLSRKACERLVSQAMGQELATDARARIIELSGGNPLFLEELMRALIEGQDVSESETVIAMLQARFGALPVSARRVLLAASLFGMRFWRGGLTGFLADDNGDDGALDAGLRILEGAELIERCTQSQLAEDSEYCFRHMLIRHAAYRLLGEADRRIGEAVAKQFYLTHPEIGADQPKTTKKVSTN